MNSQLYLKNVSLNRWWSTAVVFGIVCLSVLGATQSVQAATTEAIDFPKDPVSVRVSEIEFVNNGEQVRALTPTTGSSYVVYRDRFVGFQPVRSLMGYYNKKVIIEFTGRTAPGALVSVYLDAPKTRTHATYANELGEWNISIDASQLPAGNYNATMRASLQEQVSDMQIIGTFSVYAQNKLSNMTWIAIIVAGLGVIMTLTILNGVLLLRRS